MKSLYILFIFISISVNAQEIEVNENGLVSKLDNTKNYVIVESEGLSSKDLYNNVYKYVQKNYKNPEAVLKGSIENEFLKFDTYVPSAMHFTKSVIFDLNYTTSLYFKDGKSKIEFLNIEYTPADITMPKIVFSFKALYNKKGVLTKTDVKKEIEDYFNNIIQQISKSLKGATKEEW